MKMFTKESQPQSGENPYAYMNKDVMSDEEILDLESQDHEYSTSKLNIQSCNQNAAVVQIQQFLDERFFPKEKPKADYKLAETGKMISEMNEPISPFSSSSMIRIYEINLEDHQDSTMTSKNRPHIQLNSSSESEMESVKPSKSKGIAIKGKIKGTSLKQIVGKEKVIGKKKNDEKKNVGNNCLKFIIKEFLSDKYAESVEQLSRNNRIGSKAVRSYYDDKLSWNISLSKLRVLLNFKQLKIDDDLRRIKQTFHSFFVFYMRHKYNHHVLTEKKIEHKAKYLQAKRYLMYLPDIKPLAKFHKYLSQS